MNSNIYIAFLLSLLISYMNANAQEYRNVYGITFRGKPHDNLSYAKQMGYDYVFYQNGMERDPTSNGLLFYIESPEYLLYKRVLNYKKKYTKDEVEFYNSFCMTKDTNHPFPYNIATGWFFSDTTFSAQLDFRKKKVVTWAVRQIIIKVKEIQSRNPNFRFAGFAWDVPNVSGDFWSNRQNDGGKQVSASFWNRSHTEKNILSNSYYANYEAGRVDFYKRLYEAARNINPKVHFFVEPYDIYNDWICPISKYKTELRDIIPNMIISQESNGLNFIYDKRIYVSGQVLKSQTASSSTIKFEDFDNRKIAATAAINGAWFYWFGRFGGAGDMPNYMNITEVPPRLKLIRMIPIWENLNHIPLGERHWNGEDYSSPDAFANADYIAAKQPGTGKWFIVFNTSNQKFKLPANSNAKNIFVTDNLFVETKKVNCTYIQIKNGFIVPKTDVVGKGIIVE